MVTIIIWKINNGVFFQQNQQMMGQKKGKKILYKNDLVIYPKLSCALFLCIWGAAYPKFWINLYSYLYDGNSNNKIDLQLS